MLARDALLLPEDVTERMMRGIANAARVDVDGKNNYTIVFKPNGERDRAIREFLRE